MRPPRGRKSQMWPGSGCPYQDLRWCCSFLGRSHCKVSECVERQSRLDLFGAEAWCQSRAECTCIGSSAGQLCPVLGECQRCYSEPFQGNQEAHHCQRKLQRRACKSLCPQLPQDRRILCRDG